MKSKNDIAILICYIGKLPWYFKYFAYSCSYNSFIDFYMLTDDDTRELGVPSNIHFIKTSLEEISKNASNALGLDIKIKHAYKLCDFKPAYGVIFNDLIRNYQYWGYGDLDVIFGDIRSFFPNRILSQYDVLSVRHDFLTGYFQLFRNTDQTLHLFMESRDYEKVLTSDVHYCFDETNFTHQEFTNGISWHNIKSEIDSMMHVICRLSEEGKIKPYFDFHVIEGLPGKLKWSNGKMFYKNKYEIILYHMISFKKHGYERKVLTNQTKSFNISPQMIY